MSQPSENQNFNEIKNKIQKFGSEDEPEHSQEKSFLDQEKGVIYLANLSQAGSTSLISDQMADISVTDDLKTNLESPKPSEDTAEFEEARRQLMAYVSSPEFVDIYLSHPKFAASMKIAFLRTLQAIDKETIKDPESIGDPQEVLENYLRLLREKLHRLWPNKY